MKFQKTETQFSGWKSNDYNNINIFLSLERPEKPFLTRTVNYHRIVQRLYKHVTRSFSGQRRFLEIRPLWEIFQLLQTKKRPHGKNLWFFHLGTPKNLHIDPHNLDVFPIGSHIRLKKKFLFFFVTYFLKQGCHRILI